MQGPKVTNETRELGGAKRRSDNWLKLNQNWDAYHLKATYFRQAGAAIENKE